MSSKDVFKQIIKESVNEENSKLLKELDEIKTLLFQILKENVNSKKNLLNIKEEMNEGVNLRKELSKRFNFEDENITSQESKEGKGFNINSILEQTARKMKPQDFQNLSIDKLDE